MHRTHFKGSLTHVVYLHNTRDLCSICQLRLLNNIMVFPISLKLQVFVDMYLVCPSL